MHLIHRGGDEGQQDVQVVDHHVEDHVHVQAAPREHPQPVHLEEQRLRHHFRRRLHRRIEALRVAYL